MKRKPLAALLAALLTLLALLAAVPASAAPTPEKAMEEAFIYSVGDLLSFLRYDGDVKNVPLLLYTGTDAGGNITEYPAYCINPEKPGPYLAGTYKVDTKEYINNPKIWGIVSNGYPYKSLGDLGVATREQAFYATKMALWTYLNNWDVNLWSATNGEQTATLNALKKIYAAGMTVTEIKVPSVTVATDKPKLELDPLIPGYASQVYTVTANADIRSFEVFTGGDVPDGTKVTDMIGNPKTVFNAGERFKVIVPADRIENATGNFEVAVKGELRGNAVLYGLSYDAALQDFAVARDPFEFQTATADVLYAPQNTFLEIFKLAAGTADKLAGAVFKVTDSEGGVIGTFTTDSSGRIVVPLTKAGAFQIEELTPPTGFTLDTNAHKDVIVKWDQTTTATFTNEREPELTVRKIDADTGAGIENAVIRVARKGGMEFTDLTTGAGGWAYLSLPPGVYSAVELSVPAPYALDPTPQTIILEAGKSASVVLKNSKKPGLIVRKYDELTSLPLAGAEISVALKGGSVVFEGVTPASGMIHIENLEPGKWYTVTELAAPSGYLKATESKDVYLEAGKTVEIKLDNRLRPALRVYKTDSGTGLPLVSAKFRVQKTEDATVSEYVTDENGMFTVYDLDESVYSVWEYEAPANYLLDSTHKDIKLEWGKVKSLIFTNKAKPALEILKLDEETGAPLPGAKIRVWKAEDGTVSEYVTDSGGRILITGLEDKIYSAEECVAPAGYLLDPQHKDIKLEWGETKTLIFTDKEKPKLRILKTDIVNAGKLSDAKFRVTKVEAGTVSEYTTDSSGEILIENLDESVYRIEEYMPPDGWLLNSEPKEILLEWGKTKTVSVDNVRKPVAVFRKTNGLTGRGIPSATFKVEYEQSGGGLLNLGSYKTDADGRIIIPKAEPGWFVFTETLPAPGFSLPKNPTVRMYFAAGDNAYLPEFEHYYTGMEGTANEQAEATQNAADSDRDSAPALAAAQAGEHSGSEYYVEGEGFNWPLNSIVIKKTHAITGELLPGAVFELYRADEQVSGVPGTAIGRYTTDNSGIIVITGLDPGFYVVKEVQAPPDFLLSENSAQNGFLKPDGTTVLEFSFADYPYGSLLISKSDGLTGRFLSDARFKVTDAGGAVVGNSNGEYVTDGNGEILIPNIKPGAVIVTEIQAPANYAINTAPQTIQIGTDGKTYKAEFRNFPYGAIVIRKSDSVTKAPLADAEIRVTASDGSVVGTNNGIFKTNAEGTVIIPDLPKNTYILEEIKAPAGYALESGTQTIAVDYGKTYTANFYNKPLSGLKITKFDSLTHGYLENVEFEIAEMNGRKLTNEFNENTFKTDSEGQIYIPLLANGYYVVTETRQKDGYLLDSEPKTVLVESGKITVLEVPNTPASGLLITKTNEAGRPLGGVVIDVTRADGRRVAGNILDGNQSGTEANSPNRTTSPNGDISGSYTTDAQGRILINSLPAGEYNVVERKALDNYELDTSVHSVTVTPGKLATLQLINREKAGLRLIKIDSITKLGIYNVEFMVFDANNKVVGTYYTDSSGVIDFAGLLPEGRFTIRETRPAENYYPDDVPRTVEFKAGKTTEIRWENIPKQGQIQILKLSGDDNQINGLPAGSALEGAVFEVYDYKTGNPVDRFVSGSDGRAVSKPLPLGRYLVKEVQSPPYYKLSDKQLDIDVEFATQIVKTEFLNYSANTGVTIRKTGPAECMPGNTISYTIKELRNTSSVPLTDFYWRDTLPVDAVRLTRIVTGTYNQALKYKIMITTNKGDTRVIADNLSTTQNNVIDCANASLGLYSDEYVTSFTLLFGTVKAGFSVVEQPRIFARVNNGLPNGYEFANKSDTAGRLDREWVAGNSVTRTVIYNPKTPGGKLPRTGY